MSWILTYIGPKVFGALAALAAFMGVVVGLRADAKKDERRRLELEAAKAAARQKEAVDDAVENSHAGGSAWSERLRRDN